MRLLLRVPCPSCGLTRAARLALAGDFAGATAMHPLCLLILPFVGAIGIAECALYVRDGVWGRVVGTRSVRTISWGLVGALVAMWIARELGAFGGPAPLL
jgi:hypothetical protein